MESKRGLYKQRSRNGLGSRESRARLKEKESKSSRDALLLSKRRIPLSTVQEESKKEKKEKGAELTEAQKSEARLQKLLEWKKMREDAKKKEKTNKAKPFVAGSSRPPTASARPQLLHVFAPSIGKGVTFGGEKGGEKAVRSERGNVTKPSKVAASSVPEDRAHQPHTSARRKAVPKPKPAGPVVPVGSTSKPGSGGTSKATQPTGLSPTERGRSAHKAKPTLPAIRASKRLAEQSNKKPILGGRQASGGAVTRGVRVAKDSTATRVTRSGAKKMQPKKTTVASPPPPPPSRSKRRKKVSVPAKLAYSSSSSDSDTTSPSIPPPSAPPPSSPPHSPLPLPPSMITHRGTSHISGPFPPPVADPTWILGAGTDMFQNRTPCSSNFDDVFGSEKPFSPFIFMAGSKPRRASKKKATPKKPFAFTFKKMVNVTPLSLQAEAMCSDVTSDAISVDSLNCDSVSVAMVTDTRCTSKTDSPSRSLVVEAGCGVEGGRVGGDDGRGEGEEGKGAGEGGEEEDTAVVPGAENEAEEEEEKREDIDIGYFRKLHSDVTDVLTRKCEEWSGKSQTIEQDLKKEEEEEEGVDRKTLEEAVDQIRTTVCQAQLLMRKKMRQYLGLVDTAERGEEKMFSEDLQGFWDMMYFQVEDLFKRFDSLTELEQNNWQQPQQTGSRTRRGRGKKRAVAAKSKAGSSSQSEKQAAARERREAMRSRLREMKMAAAKRAREDQEGGEREEDREDEREKEGVEESVSETLPQPSPKKPRDESLVDHTPCQPVTPPTKCGSHGNRRRSSACSRRRSRVAKRESMALIDFSHSLLGADNLSSSQMDASPNPSGFSPPQQSTEQLGTGVDVPTADLLNFDPAPAVSHHLPMKSPLKWTPRAISKMTPSKKKTPEGASVRRFVAITPSKRMRELLDADVIMSPARRSIRIAGRASRTAEGPPGSYEVTSLLDLPEELEVAYCPNKALL